jgi:hypothetical protein
VRRDKAISTLGRRRELFVHRTREAASAPIA